MRPAKNSILVLINGGCKDVFTGAETKVEKKEPMNLEAWGYKVLEGK